MRLLLLGSTGLLGRAVRDFARQKNIEIYGVARSGSDFNNDLTDESFILSIFKQIQPTLVINAAALTNLDECERNLIYAKKINTDLPAFISKLCVSVGAQFVHISTDHFYGSGSKLHSEEEPVDLVNNYAKTKFSAESLLNHERDLIVRTNIVGFRGWLNQPTFLEWVIENLSQRNQIIGFRDVFTSSIHVNTFVSYLFMLVHKKIVGVINLASGNSCSKYDFILKLASSLDLDSNCVKPGCLDQISKIQRAKSMGLDVRKVEKILGFNMPSIDETILTIALEYKNLK